jgi:cobalt-zinc-cadmium efflux system membrane fusion protein
LRHFFAIYLMSVSLSVYAHGGEDHSIAAPALSLGVAPNAVAATEEFEIVAVLNAKKLSIYLDNFSSNEPVLKAKIEIEGAGVKAYAKEARPGVYVVDMPMLAPGKYPLTMTLESGEISDLVSLNLEIAAPAKSVGHDSDWKKSAAWLSTILLPLAGLGIFVARRRKKIQEV